MFNKPSTPLRHSARIAAQQRNCNSPRITKRQTRSPKTHLKILGPLYSSSPAQSRLLSLPAELRAMIWEAAFTSPTGTLHFSPTARHFDVSTIGAGLLTACHLTALETQWLAPRMNTLRFPSLGAAGPNALLGFCKRRTQMAATLGYLPDVKGVGFCNCKGDVECKEV